MKTFYIDKDEIGIVYAAAIIWGDIEEKEIPD
jgi:hypothetical protein